MALFNKYQYSNFPLLQDLRKNYHRFIIKINYWLFIILLFFIPIINR